MRSYSRNKAMKNAVRRSEILLRESSRKLDLYLRGKAENELGISSYASYYYKWQSSDDPVRDRLFFDNRNEYIKSMMSQDRESKRVQKKLEEEKFLSYMTRQGEIEKYYEKLEKLREEAKLGAQYIIEGNRGSQKAMKYEYYMLHQGILDASFMKENEWRVKLGLDDWFMDTTGRIEMNENTFLEQREKAFQNMWYNRDLNSGSMTSESDRDGKWKRRIHRRIEYAYGINEDMASNVDRYEHEAGYKEDWKRFRNILDTIFVDVDEYIEFRDQLREQRNRSEWDLYRNGRKISSGDEGWMELM